MLVASWGTPSKCAVRFATIMRSISKRPHRRAHCIRTLLPLHRFTAFDFDSQRYSLTILDGGLRLQLGIEPMVRHVFLLFFSRLSLRRVANRTHANHFCGDDLTRRTIERRSVDGRSTCGPAGGQLRKISWIRALGRRSRFGGALDRGLAPRQGDPRAWLQSGRLRATGSHRNLSAAYLRELCWRAPAGTSVQTLVISAGTACR